MSSKTRSQKATVQKSTAPVAYSTKLRQTNPTLRSNGNSTRLTHREYVADVTSSATAGAFSVTSYQINPGLSNLFPWLSVIAPQYESYRFRRLAFQYQPSVSTATSGVVQLAVDYDVNDAAPASKAEMMSNHRATRTNAWSDVTFHFDQKDAMALTDRRYIRSSSYPSGSDPKTYDVGTFNIATSGFATASVVCGELYVDYEVELITPQLGQSSTTATLVAGGVVSKAALFGSVPTITGGLLTGSVTNTLVFTQVGQYLVSISAVGTVLGGGGVITPTGAGTAQYYKNIGDTYAAGANLGTEQWVQFPVRVTAANQTLIFDASGATTVTACKVSVTPLYPQIPF